MNPKTLDHHFYIEDENVIPYRKSEQPHHQYQKSEWHVKNSSAPNKYISVHTVLPMEHQPLQYIERREE